MKAADTRVLVVDDDPSFRELLTGFLETRGYMVQAARNGKKALALARTHAPHVILLDLDLPGMSGLDVLRRLKVDKIDAKVICISGHEAAAEHLGPDGINLGAAQFITKPVDLEHLDMSIGAVTGESASANAHILVADDDASICELLKVFLEEKGYRVDTAPDGEAALEAIRLQCPDLLFLDLYMPKLNGIEVLQKLREEGLELAVITISGTDDEESARATFALGAADFITKPLDLEYLELSLMAKLVSLGH